MKRRSLLGLLLGGLAIAADLIAVVPFISQWFSGESPIAKTSSIQRDTKITLCLFYSWVVFSWIIVRVNWTRTAFYQHPPDSLEDDISFRYFQRSAVKRKRSRNELSDKTSSALFFVGVFLLPISILISSNYFTIQGTIRWLLIILANVWCFSVAGFLIHRALISVMPLIHPDMDEKTDFST